MKSTIEFSKEQYQELIELVFIADTIKTMRTAPESYEQITNQPSTKLKNLILGQAKRFNSEHLIESHPELKGQLFLNDGDNLLEKYLGM